MSAFNLTRFNLLHGEIAAQNKPIVMFDGKSIDENISGLNILNVTIGAVEIENKATPRQRRPGSDFNWNRHGTRPITILVELPLNKSVYAENVRKLRAWAQSDEPKGLKLPAYKNDLIHATLTGFSEFTLREWWKPIELVFTAWDPYFENVNESLTPITSSIVIGGNGDPSVRITYNLDDYPLTNPEWSFEDGKTLKLAGSYTIGELVIDFDRRAIYHNGASVMSNLALTSRFTTFRPGVHIINGPEGGVARWKERWA